MSLILRSSLAANSQQKRIMDRQYAANRDLQMSAVTQNGDPIELILRKSGLSKSIAGNKGLTPADAYREFDTMTKIEQVPAGEHALLSRVLLTNRSIDLGKTVYDYRKSSDARDGKTSLTGQTGIALDHADYGYGGAIVPIHDGGFGRNWREYLAMQSDGFDAMVDDAREKERGIMNTMDSFMWSGDASLVVDGKSWLGLKADPTVVNSTMTVDLTSGSAADVYNQVRVLVDTLRITNNCANMLDLIISREIMSYWQTPFATTDYRFGSIYDMVMSLNGINSIVEDSKLSGSECALLWIDLQGFSSLIGQGMSTYALPRLMHNSDFSFIKWCCVGFLAKTDYSNRKCALYAHL